MPRAAPGRLFRHFAADPAGRKPLVENWEGRAAAEAQNALSRASAQTISGDAG